MTIQPEYNHANGTIEVRLPSGSRASFTKHTIHRLLPLLNLIHMQPTKFNDCMTQAQIDKLVDKFLAAGNTIIKPKHDHTYLAPERKPVPTNLNLADLIIPRAALTQETTNA